MRLGAPADPIEAALRVASALDEAEIPYALGGALAYGLWAVPRATVDVDVNVSSSPTRSTARSTG